jgi:hypothetical protein
MSTSASDQQSAGGPVHSQPAGSEQRPANDLHGYRHAAIGCKGIGVDAVLHVRDKQIIVGVGHAQSRHTERARRRNCINDSAQHRVRQHTCMSCTTQSAEQRVVPRGPAASLTMID